MRRIKLSKEKRQLLWKCTQGSISVLLTLILVPVVSVAGLIVDYSRYQLAKAQVSSAADLTMNTALADYDTVLKDVYGLFAISQNSDSLSTNLHDYFTATLEASGIDADSAVSNSLLSSALSTFSGESSDLLRVSLADEDGLTVNGVSGTQLAKADMLKNQIVEFCKYRTPVNSCASIIESIQSLSKLQSQTDVAQSEAQVAEDYSNLCSACETLYTKCKAYYDAVNKMSGIELGKVYSSKKGKQVTYTTQLADALGYLTYVYGHEYPYYIVTYSDNNKTPTFSRDTGSFDASGVSYGEKKSDWGEVKICGYYHVDQINNINTLLKDPVANKEYILELYKDIKDEFATVRSDDFSILTEPLASGGDFKENYVFAYQTFMSYYECLYKLGKALGGDELKNNDLNESGDKFGFDNLVTRAYTYYKALISVKDTYQIKANGLIEEMNRDYKGDKTALTALEKAAGEAVKAAGEVKTLVENLNEHNEAFSTAITKYGSKDNFSASMSSEQSGYEETVSLDDLEKLIETMQAGQNYAKSGLTYIDGYQFRGQAIGSYTKSSDNMIEGFGCGVIWVHWTSAKNNLWTLMQDSQWGLAEPDSGTNPGSVDAYKIDELGFWKYLCANFKDAEKNSNDPTEGEKNSAANNAKSAAEDATSDETPEGASTKTVSGSLPSGNKDNKTGGSGSGDDDSKKASVGDINTSENTGYSTMLGNMSESLGSILTDYAFKEMMTNARDNLYVTDYAFNMFSFATQVKEAQEEGSSTDAEGNQTSALIKTCTGNDINAANDYLYGGEIEYLIYGKSTVAANVGLAKASIFAIQFAANAVYALTNSEVNTETLAPAIAIQAATAGIVPYKVVQVVIKLSLALAQTAIDMQDLMAGKSVPLWKDSKSWYMSYSGLVNGLSSAVETGVKQAGEAVKGTVSNVLDDAADKAKTTVDEYTEDATTAVNGMIEQAVSGVCNSFSQTLISAVGSVSSKAISSGKSAADLAEEVCNSAISKAEEYVEDASLSESIKGTLKKIITSDLKPIADSKLKEIENMIKDAQDGKPISNAVTTIQKDITKALTSKVSELTASISTRFSGVVDDLQRTIQEKCDGAVDEATDELVDATNDWINGNLGGTVGATAGSGTTGVDGKTSAVSQLLSFHYSDYLKMFLFLGLTTNNATVVCRVGDLIQLNISQEGFKDAISKVSGNTSFTMDKAYTYVELEANAYVETMFLNYPVITRRMGKDGISGFKLSYHGALGY